MDRPGVAAPPGLDKGLTRCIRWLRAWMHARRVGRRLQTAGRIAPGNHLVVTDRAVLVGNASSDWPNSVRLSISGVATPASCHATRAPHNRADRRTSRLDTRERGASRRATGGMTQTHVKVAGSR